MKSAPHASTFRAKLRACVADELDAHWRQLDGGHCRNLRNLVLSAAEDELLDFAMRRAENNRARAAKILGVSLATLSRKLAPPKPEHKTVSKLSPKTARRAKTLARKKAK